MQVGSAASDSAYTICGPAVAAAAAAAGASSGGKDVEAGYTSATATTAVPADRHKRGGGEEGGGAEYEGGRGGEPADAQCSVTPKGRAPPAGSAGTQAPKRPPRTGLVLCACLLFVAVTVLAIVLPVCLVRGCPVRPRRADASQLAPEEALYSLRLLARMDNTSRRVAELLPPLLRDFVSVSRLEESGIEFLDFGDLAVLRRVRLELETKYADLLTFLVPDFPVLLGRDLAAEGSLATLADANNDDPDTAEALQQLAQDVASSAAPVPDSSSSSSASSPLLSSLSTSASSAFPTSLLAALQQPATGTGGAVGAAADGLQEHAAAVDAATAAAAKALSAPAGAAAVPGAPPDSILATASATTPGLQWYLRRTAMADAWALTMGVPDVVVAVVDSGFDVNHPDLKANLWVNAGEVAGDGKDNDDNGYVDDINGFDFAGSGAYCQGDWRSSSPPPPSSPPSPSPPSPPSPSPPPPPAAAVRRSPPPPPPRKATRAAARASAAAATTTTTAYQSAQPSTASQLARVCVPDGDVSPESTDDGHGTHVAGIVAAARDVAAQVAGAAPRVRLMLLKVFDGQQRVWASNVVAAYAYALRMGAHIVSCSFGPAAPNLAPAPYQLVQMAAQERLYGSAVQPLADRGVLLVAAAGNELTDLNGLAAVGSNYLPCTLPYDNVMCVTGSNQADQLITGMDGNRQVGVNWGSEVVHIAAPGQDIFNTLPTSMGMYGNKTGSSMATPLVAGVAALVASVVGSVGNLTSRPNYYQAAAVKPLLLESADALPGLPVRGSRRLNALRAVQAAYVATAGSYLLTPSSTYYVTNAGSASMLAPGLAEEYFAAAAATGSTAAAAAADISSVTVPDTPFDSSIRVPSAAAPVTRLTVFKYGVNMSSSTTAVLPAGTAPLLRLSGLLRLNASGGWGVQLLGLTLAARVRLAVGKRLLNLTSSGATATLMAQVPGLYDFELLVLNPGPPLELRWAQPSAPGLYSAPSSDMFIVPSYAPAVHPRYAPNISLPFAASSPPGWHVAWEYAAADPSRPAPLEPSLLSTFSPGLPPSSGPWTPLRNTAARPGLFPAPGAFGEMAVAAATAAAAAPDASSAIVVPDAVSTGAYGYAITHMSPPAKGSGVAFQLSCSSCRLFVQGVLVADASQALPLGSSTAAGAGAAPPPATAQSGCLSLTTSTSSSSSPPAAAVYTLELRFAVGNLSSGLLDVTWAACVPAGSWGGGGPVGQWSSLEGLLTSAVLWAPPAGSAVRRSALRCDLWRSAGAADGGRVPAPRERAPLASFTLPRPGSRNQNCTLFSSTPNCTGLALVSALDILPTAQSGTPYHVRCWAFWSGSFRRAVFTMRSATSTTASPVAAATYLGSQMVGGRTAEQSGILAF
ncbi:hypothetical protein GPECTOR_24g241 [Gonium pectorale]|uniref:Peptidase S8/S53 domain-containing protein n=1 Tax=Gonium pectorale TaxID=33097 RepID=A0A150GGI2_GONPE|nr:hypothetical protein GPECTOR_24g241 [Gonium pectorale]|eukprot:KXZ48951.1 hypothetical protein GPECTOR_24g241 [Gonium pectorale]